MSLTPGEIKQDKRNGLLQEVARRRTFAIISHPDAGKITLTEKLLLYAGAVDLAGAVRTRGNLQHAASDWMNMERQRGISVSATAAGDRVSIARTFELAFTLNLSNYS